MPPLRRPRLSNIAVKTYLRIYWYFLEVLPLFVLGSMLIWIGRLTGLFTLALKVMEYPTYWIGLPSAAAEIFLFGFFRRDFGAAGIYGMYNSGALTGVQLLVAAVTLTLFMPCIAQFMMTIKERGFKTALAISGFIFPFAFLTGFLVNTSLKLLGGEPLKCPPSGNEFEKADETKCTGCGKLHNCNKQCCPNCGYELVKEAKIIQTLRRLFK